MRYYLDTEFNGYGGDLISLALVREDGESIYIVVVQKKPGMVFVNGGNCDSWVRDNVLPILMTPGQIAPQEAYMDEVGPLVAGFLAGDPAPVVVADWPDDIRYFCEAAITGPGTMIDVPSLSFEVHRVDAYPTDLEGAVQHNAWWDAMALRHLLTERT